MKNSVDAAAVRPAKKKFSVHSPKFRNNLFAYSMLAPDVIGLIIFFGVPIGIAIFISFHDWNALEPMKYIGVDNYATMMTDSDWWGSVLNTLIYTVIFVPLVFCLSLLMAVFINSIPGKIQEVIRTLFFIPYAVSTVVAALIWRFMMDPQRGFLNKIFSAFGFPKQNFLGDPKQALVCIAIISAWIMVGYYCIIFLSALKDISPTYYEAAHLDGANAIQVFKNITFPLLREVSVFVLVVTTIASFQVFDLIKILTNGGPDNATNVSVFYIYKNAFEYMKIGYSSAMAFVLFLIIFVLSIFQLKLTKGDPDNA